MSNGTSDCLTNDESHEKVPTAIEVREELTELTEVSFKKFQGILNRLDTLEEIVEMLEHARDESWEAISNKVSTLVEGSVSTLNGRLTELEHTVQSQRTTPIADEDDVLNMETWSTLEQVIWTELGKVRDQTQEIPNLYTICEKLRENQRSHEKQLSVLRNFARQVEQYLERMSKGALAPKDTRQPSIDESGPGAPQAYVPGASVSSSAVPSSSIQMPTPPTVPVPPIPTSRDGLSSQRESASSSSNPTPQRTRTRFSTVKSQVRSRAIRMDITNPEQCQEAKKVRDIGSLIFETPIQHDDEAGVEVRSLLSSEQFEEIDGRLAVMDVNPSTGSKCVRFWVDEVPLNDVTENHEDRGSIPLVTSQGVSRTPIATDQRELGSPTRRATGGGYVRESPEFGGDVYHDREEPTREHIPSGDATSSGREPFPNNERMTPPRVNQSRTPPEEQNPKGCSLHSMEPLRDWVCKGADMTSAAEYEAALCQLEDDPPDIRQYNVNIGGEMDSLLLGGSQIPAMTVDVIQRGEALAIFERDLIIHFQQISRAAALYIRALLGGGGGGSKELLRFIGVWMRPQRIIHGHCQPRKKSGIHMQKEYSW